MKMVAEGMDKQSITVFCAHHQCHSPYGTKAQKTGDGGGGGSGGGGGGGAGGSDRGGCAGSSPSSSSSVSPQRGGGTKPNLNMRKIHWNTMTKDRVESSVFGRRRSMVSKRIAADVSAGTPTDKEEDRKGVPAAACCCWWW